MKQCKKEMVRGHNAVMRVYWLDLDSGVDDCLFVGLRRRDAIRRCLIANGIRVFELEGSLESC